MRAGRLLGGQLRLKVGENVLVRNGLGGGRCGLGLVSGRLLRLGVDAGEEVVEAVVIGDGLGLL